MSRIQKLPQSEVDRICAGEVIDRPASAVKELVENALDGGATRIEITIEDGGKRLITVSDDGCGISSSELELAISQHCTSKIERADDLQEKHSLGFRGEALYSIAAISKMRLTSRNGGESTGAYLYLEAGGIKDQKKTAFNPGTSVSVRELFFNTPVRRKFLKSKNTEVSFITSLVLEYALAYSEIGWRLVSDGKELVNLVAKSGFGRALERVFDEKTAQEMVEISFELEQAAPLDEGPPPALSIAGVIGLPHLHRSVRSGQFFFVNRRPVKNKIFFRAVDDTFRGHLSPGKHGICVLLLSVPPSQMDVNIHPSKLEVDFSNSQQIYALITVAIKRALAGGAADRRMKMSRELGLDSVPPPESLEGESISGLALTGGSQPLGQTGGSWPKGREKRDDAGFSYKQEPAAGLRTVPLITQPLEPLEEEAPHLESPSAGYAQEWKETSASREIARELGDASLLGQIDNTFIAFATEKALFLIDQHSAHESILFRILYDEVTGAESGPPRQSLVFPMLLNVRTDQAVAIETVIPAINRLGFSLELFGESTLLLREIPLVLGSRFSLETFTAMLDEILATGKERSYNNLVKHIAATAACKAAVKAGDSLSEDEMVWLVKSLTISEDSLSCPHGRPTVLRLGAKEIGKLFQR